MLQLTPKQFMVPAVVGMTLLHLGIRWSARGDREPMDVSPLRAGQTVSVAPVMEQVASLLPDHCLQVIVFSPDCPFCQHAADREATAVGEASRAQRLWYTDAETASLPYFVSQHLHRPPGISAELVKELKIQAVPALFVLSAEGQIRWVGSYFGDESEQELAGRCTGAPHQAPKT